MWVNTNNYRHQDSKRKKLKTIRLYETDIAKLKETARSRSTTQQVILEAALNEYYRKSEDMK